MQDRPVQKFFAYAALFLLPFPALNFGVSFTIADVFLVLAIVLNLHEVLQLHAFQIPFLLAIPFLLISALLDPDGSLIATGQLLYIWGIVLPFGWCAFTNLPIRRIAHVLLLAVAINCVVAAGQSARVLPQIGSQNVVDSGKDVNRGAGLNLGCNDMMMQLTPMFLLLPYIRRTRIRLANLAALLVGIVASVSKASILAIPGFIYYLVHEPRKKQFTLLASVAMLLTIAILPQQRNFIDFSRSWQDYVESRMEHSAESISHRRELLEFAFDLVPKCYFFGFGLGGTNAIMQQANNNVHVYCIGLVLVAGVPAATLIFIGFITLFQGLRRSGEIYFAWYLIAHLLACSVMTVLAVSFQNLPFMVAGAVFVRRHQANIEAAKKEAAAAKHPRLLKAA
jgi:hypothetical protein